MKIVSIAGPMIPAVLIEEGDTLIQICRTLTGDESRWREILPLNPGLELHPDFIMPGEKYAVPRDWVADELRER